MFDPKTHCDYCGCLLGEIRLIIGGVFCSDKCSQKMEQEKIKIKINDLLLGCENELDMGNLAIPRSENQ
jgi:predicted nucleic acid-binding Zn ribbon protein